MLNLCHKQLNPDQKSCKPKQTESHILEQANSMDLQLVDPSLSFSMSIFSVGLLPPFNYDLLQHDNKATMAKYLLLQGGRRQLLLFHQCKVCGKQNFSSLTWQWGITSRLSPKLISVLRSQHTTTQIPLVKIGTHKPHTEIKRKHSIENLI